MVKGMLPLMKGRSWGRIVKTGSAPMVKGVGEQTHYVAAEAGVSGFSRSLARAVGIEGITINLVTPGLSLAPSVVKLMPQDFVAPQGNARVIQRDETAEDLVGAVFSLALPDDGFISGRTVNVDRGKPML
jgi:NAD(P)-dependent dehydrogenase (short-subunit alcohol dehydrogenase family)